MKPLIYSISLFLTIVLFLSCESTFMEPDPGTSNRDIFNEYTNIVKQKYAMLEFKNVDIVELQSKIGATITENTTQAELFNALGSITLSLRDGHSTIQKEDTLIGYDFTEGYPPGFDIEILNNNYIATSTNSQMNRITAEGDEEIIIAVYGNLPQDEQLAYLRIPSWDVIITDEQIENIFASFANAKGLIFDIRQNTGGNPVLATKFASYLTNDVVFIGEERFKTGPDANDFSNSKAFLKPANSEVRFTRPVAVLTDRYCYSASTTFVASVNPLERVTIIGQRTGGGSGSVGDGYLANGWKWSLSTSEFIDYQNNNLDDGFDPDIPVLLDLQTTDKDEVIERAIMELQ